MKSDEQWVTASLEALDPPRDWHPNSSLALARLTQRDKRHRTWQRGWLLTASTLAAGLALMLALPTNARCAIAGVGCPRPVLLAPAVTAKPAPLNYKEAGSPAAPVVMEIYSDYECPFCAVFYTNVVPQLTAEFVKTGKVRIIHRDFPLPQHPFAKLAARYANAAGETGHYEEAVDQLFRRQSEWTAKGNVDSTLSNVLSPETMQKIRTLVQTDPALDTTIATDFSAVTRDQVNQTPTIVFVYKGVRRKVVAPPTFDLLRSYLNELLAH
jgi:protein-disulfide isomerase